jgi:CheY-like chemotaxis protein
MNLCANAYQSLPDRQGALEVVLALAEVGPGFTPDVGQLAPGTYVRLSVRDTGSGIDPSTLPHIFDPFFTTKKPGEGTGLGLSTVHGIVSGYGGGIVVQSGAGRGSCFEVYLPKVDEATRPADRTLDPPAGGSERILFVDDNEEIAEMACGSLRQLGYSVTAFSSSAEALAAFRACPDDFDLVITDQVMPEMTGANLSRELLRIRPDLPIILVSGFGQGLTFEQARTIGISDYLMKPFSDKVLCATIRQALKDREPAAVAEPSATLS